MASTLLEKAFSIKTQKKMNFLRDAIRNSSLMTRGEKQYWLELLPAAKWKDLWRLENILSLEN
ncbi:MAG: hypothetical protein WCJ84_06170 [Candidatus Peregrinibacteria bacterium]